MKKLLLTSSIVIGALYFGAPVANAAACSPSDVSFTIGSTVYTPTSCVNNAFVSNSNPATETTELNTAFNNNPAFQFAAKDDGTSQTLLGIKFTLSAQTTNQAGTLGTWTVTWTDTNGPGNPLDLPISISMDLGIDGGSTGDGYAFSNVILPITPNTGTGNFNIVFTNNGGQNPALSHMIIDVGQEVGINQQCTGNTCVVDAPEPSTLSLLGLGALAMIGFTRLKLRS